MITIRKGNIFDSEMQVLVNPVNCVGVMGKGLALEFKQRYPLMFKSYMEWCEDKTIYPGNPCFWRGCNRDILLFPTKYHWKEKSDMFCIEQGLDTLIHHIQNDWTWGFKSIAFPALGCGLGGLSWENVAIAMVSKLLKISDDIDVEIYEPEG